MAHATIIVELLGDPVGKGRPRFRRIRTKAGQEFVSTYSPGKTVKYEDRLRQRAQHVMDGRAPLAGPLAVTVLAVFPLRDSWTKVKRREAMAQRLRPTVKPDADNILKLLDAFNKIVWLDDVQIVEARVIKLYGAHPRITIEVTPLDATQSAADPATQTNLPLSGAAA